MPNFVFINVFHEAHYNKQSNFLHKHFDFGNMADSRIASVRLFIHKHRPEVSTRTLLFAGCGVAAFLLSLWLREPSFTPLQNYTLFLVFFAVALWVTEAIPPFAVSILIIGFLAYTQGTTLLAEEAKDVSKYVNTWSSPVIWLMLGGFFMAKGMEKTHLDRRLFKTTLRVFGTKRSRLLLGLMLTTGLGSMLMSNTAITAMMIAAITPLLVSLSGEPHIRKALLLGIPAAASVGGMGTIIGSPPNAIAVGALNARGVQIDFVEWMIIGFPIALLMIFVFWLILTRYFKIRGGYFEMPAAEEHASDATDDDLRFEHQQRNIVTATILLTVGLWITSPLHGLPVAAVSGIPIVFLTVAGVVNSDDVRSLPWDTLMLVAGGLALGIAILDTGLANAYLAKVNFDAAGPYVFIVLAGLGLLTVVLSNIMSNTATASILIPIAMVSLPEYALAVALVIGLSASNALFLPISTPPNAMVFSTGYLVQKDFRLGGLSIGLLGPLLVTLFTVLMLYALPLVS